MSTALSMPMPKAKDCKCPALGTFWIGQVSLLHGRIFEWGQTCVLADGPGCSGTRQFDAQLVQHRKTLAELIHCHEFIRFMRLRD